MKTLQAYFGDPAIKEKFVSQMIAHRKADQLIHGVYWENGKGCAVGCITHSANHTNFQKQLGLPTWLAYLVDYLFEGLKNGESMTFPERVLQVIPVGANLDKTYHKFQKYILNEIVKDADDKNVRKAIEDVLTLHQKAIDGKIRTLPEVWRRSAAWSAAESAAWSAARSAAESAAWSAAESAARSAAWSAARSAAESAAWSAAWSAAESAAVSKMANKLIELLKEAEAA